MADNIFLGRKPVRRGIMDRARMRRETCEALALFGSGHGIEPDSLVSELGITQQQMVEIAKAVSLEARSVVMDEPTAALDENECAVLFSINERLKEGHEADGDRADLSHLSVAHADHHRAEDPRRRRGPGAGIGAAATGDHRRDPRRLRQRDDAAAALCHVGCEELPGYPERWGGGR